MLTLMLDSSNTDLSIGISKDYNIIYKTSFACWQRQSELMIPELEKALKETSLEINDFDEIVCSIGPGSYTGIRIALTIAKTIAVMNENIKLKCVSSLRIFGGRDKKFIALMNARSKRSYIGVYDKEKTVLEDRVLTNEEVLSFIKDHPEYEVIGEVEYLGLENNLPDVITSMNSLSEILPTTRDVLSVKPSYLKD